jgi:hypothetical protein
MATVAASRRFAPRKFQKRSARRFWYFRLETGLRGTDLAPPGGLQAGDQNPTFLLHGVSLTKGQFGAKLGSIRYLTCGFVLLTGFLDATH